MGVGRKPSGFLLVIIAGIFFEDLVIIHLR